MTLNITAASPEIVLQVSDRRFTDGETGALVDDSANKAILVGCKDAAVSITFCGVGTFLRGGVTERIDWWLAVKMLNAGIPELTASDAVAFTAEASSKLFREFARKEAHTFTIAAFTSNGASSSAEMWLVSNDAAIAGQPPGILESFKIHDVFSTRRRRRGMLSVTGLSAAVTRSIRRRMVRALEGSRSAFEAEQAIVRAVQESALSPDWSWGIGRDCMAIALHPGRIARATYYPSESDPRALGPTVLWHTGKNNALFSDIHVSPGEGYGVVFGAGHSAINLLVGRPLRTENRRSAIAAANQVLIGGTFRFSNLKHGSPTSDTAELIAVLSDHHMRAMTASVDRAWVRPTSRDKTNKKAQ